jgi:hypothetical protein
MVVGSDSDNEGKGEEDEEEDILLYMMTLLPKIRTRNMRSGARAVRLPKLLEAEECLYLNWKLWWRCRVGKLVVGDRLLRLGSMVDD